MSQWSDIQKRISAFLRPDRSVSGLASFDIGATFRSGVRTSLMGLGLIFYILIWACLLWILYAINDLPNVEDFWQPNRPVSVQILDRNGDYIGVRGARDVGDVKIEGLPPHMVEALLAIEDQRFYQHAGLDPLGLGRAAYYNSKAGEIVQGGSTLTQQLAKNVFLTAEKTYRRKLQEGLLAIWLEYSFTKNEILEKYLSRVYFGGGAWGVETASRQYFQKPVKDISLGEAALLVGLLKAPSHFNPTTNVDEAAHRTAVVLKTMHKEGYIDSPQLYAALSDPIIVYPSGINDSTNYFADWVWEDLLARIGVPRADIVVRTTLDLEAQKSAALAVRRHLNMDAGATQAAIVMLDGDGGVRAMIGGASYEDNQFNRAVQAKRQPGSAFKPFVYWAAFRSGLTPWDIRVDQPIILGDWEPRNFKETFRGDVTLEDALALSINTVVVTLSEEIGRDNVVEAAGKFGLKGLEPVRSLPLGSQDVSLIDLTQAYMPFANWGNMAEPFGIISISMANGTPLYNYERRAPTKIMNFEQLGYMNRVLHQAVQRGTGRAARISGWDVAGKTGTTNDYRDAWFVGYVPDRVTGIWVGADGFTPMKSVTGGTIPARIWHDMMSEVLKDRPAVRLPMAEKPATIAPETDLENLLNDIETSLP